MELDYWLVNCLSKLSEMNGDTTFLRLQEDEIKYRGMFENAIEGIYQSTPDGHYLVVNAALARMYGYEHPSELMNQVSDIQSQIYVDSRAAALIIFGSALLMRVSASYISANSSRKRSFKVAIIFFKLWFRVDY